MTWTHKVVMSTVEVDGFGVDTSFRIAEYYPDLDAWTKNPVAPAEESIADLVWSLEKMLEAAKAALANPSLIIDEYEKEMKKAIAEADAGEFATGDKVAAIRTKYLD